MKNCRNTIGQDVKSARHQIPVTLSRTGLTVFPRSNGVDVSLEKLVAVICRNLIFYQIQRMCSKNADEQNNVSPAFSAYSDKMRHFLHNSDCLELYLCDKSSEMNSTDTKRIWESLEHLPNASEDLPKEILVIQKFIQRLKNLCKLSVEEFGLELYRLQADWISSLCSKDMLLLSAEHSLRLAEFEISRRISRHEKSQKNKEKWGEEFHIYYTRHLAAGHCKQTAKRMAREDFVKAHPLSQSEDDIDCTNFPGHHRGSLLSYHRTYLQKMKSNQENSSQNQPNEVQR